LLKNFVEKFLINLGLREYPTLERILKLAAPPAPSRNRLDPFRNRSLPSSSTLSISTPSKSTLSISTPSKSTLSISTTSRKSKSKLFNAFFEPKIYIEDNCEDNHKDNHEIREKALNYFIDNYETKYSSDYNSSKINTEFLPCSKKGTYAKPSECFINLECEVMNFKVIRQDLQFKVEKIGVNRHPNREKLLNKLKRGPPKEEDEARKIFEYLTSQQGNFTQSDWKILADLKFIPIRDDADKITHTKPGSGFFKIPDDTCVVHQYYLLSSF
jgi:hypothetical protein